MDLIIDFIKKYDNFLIFGHDDPDADCICSSIALSIFINSLGKTTHIYTQMPFYRRELKQFEKYCKSDLSPEDITENSAVILIDHHSLARTAQFTEAAASLPVAIIDHHNTASDAVPEGVVAVFIDSKAPSATILINRLMRVCKYIPDAFVSKLIFLGLSTDTGFFRHLQEHSFEAFRLAGKLTEFGVSPNKVFYEVYGNRSLASRTFLGIMLSRIQTFFDDQLLIVHEKISDLEHYSLMDRDKDMLYQILLGTAGVKIVASFREEEVNKCSVSLRTTAEINVAKIAREFGGGGHKKASGYAVDSTVEAAISDLVSYTERFLKANAEKEEFIYSPAKF
ncbi:MAG: bifunctional oligoribonuclease/PAP phosphatase NrnA [Spirochaetes bacterium]|nr:bifunctional oligoribonuclease/PAP phosphatase NrnA [Spirochaetota bacterium]